MRSTPPKVEPYQNSELCQSCAACCKVIWWFTQSFDDYLRYTWLGTDLITVETVNDEWWRIKIHAPCKQLEEVEPGKYSCKVYTRVRPSYCKTYPNSLLPELKRWHEDLVTQEVKFCPALKLLLEEQNG